MSKIIKIKSGGLCACISTLGAELISVICDGEEQIWQGDPRFWTGHSPILFPVCGELRDNKFTYQGKEYNLRKHGFASIMEFSVESVTESSAVFLLRSDETTRESYPFDFEFRVKYELSGRDLRVIYETKNLTDGDMYFSVGAHESYTCPEGLSAYKLIFDCEESFDSATFTPDKVIGDEIISFGKNTRELPLKDEYYERVGVLQFLNIKSRGVRLVNTLTGKERRLDFGGIDYFFVWSRPGAGYVCLEPWRGHPDLHSHDGDITRKSGIIRLAKGETDVTVHTITY